MRYPKAKNDPEAGFVVYSEEAVCHFMNPRNQARLERVSGKGCTSSESLEDFMQLSIHVDAQEHICGVHCHTVGCAAAVACGSVFSELLKGLTVAEATALGSDAVFRALGRLPDSCRYCARLPVVALQAAVEDYDARCRLADRPRPRSTFSYRRLGESSA